MRNRLILAFISLLLMMSASSYLSVLYFDSTAKDLQNLVQDEARRTILAQRASQQAQMAAGQLLRLLQTEDREERKQMYRAMDKALAMSDAAVRTLSKEPDYANVSKLINLREEYGILFQQTVELIEFEGLQTAKQHFDQHTNPVLEALLAETEKVSVEQQDSMLESEQQLQDRAGSVKLIIVFSEVVLIVISLMLAVRIARSFAREIDGTIEAADRIADGDYDAYPTEVNAPEMLRLDKALNRMRHSILTRELVIKRVAYEDSVTKLSNRNKFFETLEDRVPQGSGSIILFDINRFSQINSALGHEIGDIVLQEIGRRIADYLSPADEVARLEGNKFAVLLDGITDIHALKDSLEELHGVVGEPVEIRQQRLDIDMSAGATRFPDTSRDIHTLLRSAETALASAKRAKERYQISYEATGADDQIHLSLLGELRVALQNDQFRLHYQPKFDLSNFKLKSVEALVRWEHPTKGQIRPDLFIPFAEKTGFVRQITPWVIRQAVKDAQFWLASGKDISVSVNVSVIDLTNPALVPTIQRALEEHPIPPSRLCLEVTESALMDDPSTSFDRLKALRALGVTLSMDDYGTGQASLAYVRDMPVNELKIDRSFVTDIDSNPKNAAIVWSTLLLCKELGIEVVAEGVETDAEFRWLIEHQCGSVQGYRVSRPLPLEKLLLWEPDEKLLALKD